MSKNKFDNIISLCKRRGFIFPSAMIYGGLQGFYDYGPHGVSMKRQLIQSWWEDYVEKRHDIHGVDGTIITHQKILQYSGHEKTFTDPMVDCRACQSRWRADLLVNNQCLACGSTDLTEPRDFNLMFQTQVGPVQHAGSQHYLRPETAQSIFTNFKNVCDSIQPKIPFGIAQAGRAFRNEITPRNFIFRVREFEQMEIEFFVKPGDDEHWHDYWVNERYDWWLKQGLTAEKLVKQVQPSDDLAHYAKATVDLCYEFPHGLEEIEGIANRTDYDLGSHSKNQDELNIQATVGKNVDSVAKLAIQDPSDKSWYIPYVIEPSAGVDRGLLALLCDAYTEEQLDNGKERTVLKLANHLSPVKVAVVPLAKNNMQIIEQSSQLVSELNSAISGSVVLENTGNVGKAYRKHDEIGTPVCVTIDFETIGADDSPTENHQTVTVRDRDTLRQTRVSTTQLAQYLNDQYFSTT
ncbi:MAG: glycine--tRNA ligase [Legionellales bacterium]|nr:glycine--tRNA ligase [Legionellales bacterium]|tara:strand:- start:1436 stop:2827 length:1392 start_codon:yes stop_codon:yes gene_type:complete